MQSFLRLRRALSTWQATLESMPCSRCMLASSLVGRPRKCSSSRVGQSPLGKGKGLGQGCHSMSRRCGQLEWREGSCCHNEWTTQQIWIACSRPWSRPTPCNFRLWTSSLVTSTLCSHRPWMFSHDASFVEIGACRVRLSLVAHQRLICWYPLHCLSLSPGLACAVTHLGFVGPERALSLTVLRGPTVLRGGGSAYCLARAFH